MFEDRQEAGRILGKKLLRLGIERAVVLAIPRGGLPVAAEIAKELKAKLGVLVTKKIGAPGHEELAIGAVGPEGEVVLDNDLIGRLGVSQEKLESQVQKSKTKIQRYKSKFKDSLDLKDRSVILVDDGIATGATTEVAVKHLRDKRIKRIVLAVPVAPPEVVSKFEKLVDELVVLETPSNFAAVGQFYRNFPQVMDEEVLQYLK